MRGKERRGEWAARERRGRPKGRGKREQAELQGWAAFSSFLFFPFYFLYSNHSNKPI
jgi:hypothetical protein